MSNATVQWMDKLTLNEYMDKYKIKSRQTVYNQINAGTLKSEKIGWKLYILLSNDQNNLDDSSDSPINNTTDQKNNSKLNELENEIRHLKENNESLKKDKSYLEERLKETTYLQAQSQNIIAQLSGTVQQQKEKIELLTAATQEKEEQIKLLEAKTKPKSFLAHLKRIFKK